MTSINASGNDIIYLSQNGTLLYYNIYYNINGAPNT